MKANTPTVNVTFENLKTSPTINLLMELDVYLDMKTGEWGSCLTSSKCKDLDWLARELATIYRRDGDKLREQIALEVADIWESRS